MIDILHHDETIVFVSAYFRYWKCKLKGLQKQVFDQSIRNLRECG